MGKVTSEAIALRRTPFGETSQVAEFLTRRDGRLSVISKGVFRPKSTKGGGVDLLDVCRLTYVSRSRSRSLPMLTERHVLSHHPGMRTRDDLLTAGLELVELLRSLVAEGQRIPGLYDLAAAYLAALDARPAPATLPAIVFALEGGILRMTGFEPVLDRCVSCERRPTGHTVLRCDPSRGGLLCSACRDGSEDVFDLSAAAAKTIMATAGRNPQSMRDVELPPRQVRDIRRFYQRMLVHLLERRPRCLYQPYAESTPADGGVPA